MLLRPDRRLDPLQPLDGDVRQFAPGNLVDEMAARTIREISREANAGDSGQG